jgi:hypothetical protein
MVSTSRVISEDRGVRFRRLLAEARRGGETWVPIWMSEVPLMKLCTGILESQHVVLKVPKRVDDSESQRRCSDSLFRWNLLDLSWRLESGRELPAVVCDTMSVLSSTYETYRSGMLIPSPQREPHKVVDLGQESILVSKDSAALGS